MDYMEEKNISEIGEPLVRFNSGTDDGKSTIFRSIKELGCGRSILLDKDNNVLAGDKVLEQAINAGIKKVLIVDSDGSQLIAVRRNDISYNERKGMDLAFMDNLCSDKNLCWDTEAIKDVMNRCWSFDPRFWGFVISCYKKMDINDFFNELQEDAQKVTPVKQSNIAESYPSLFDLMDF